ncbi:NXPE family member 3-like isoform X1 [Erpetoichthys calabaricus]|uniref:NXPE family member 3-like n=2 Tax=Erpetoichthys calabaricus TaxID=27687 RepID=A0A8C4S241_ERPCA|nr:NXPE family member 3-like isoform X1 [Erpetoichthys calabaricus]XP_028654027.1 NXPE family member 3-like isoform X1 [Erpetoichthys calabaricus]XP_051780034.1 NXPE family member 3-like isoform X1 [Erpetoichthys calabaricus]XP_051780035.1 NXPE family member 3-like isoform X1 [Erpetoichthys calabaricus]
MYQKSSMSRYMKIFLLFVIVMSLGTIYKIWPVYFFENLLAPSRKTMDIMETLFAVPVNTNLSSTTRLLNKDVSAVEEEQLKEALAWPAPEELVSFENSTDPRICSCFIKNLNKTYFVGDTLDVILVARNQLGNLKHYGGDFFQAKIHSPEQKASTYGIVVDHRNGSYTAKFLLLWSGKAQVSIRMIHSSEAVAVIRKLRESDPHKVFFYGYFEHGKTSEKTVCNILETHKNCCCTYVDPITQDTWYCGRPPTLTCDKLKSHSMGGYKAKLSKSDENLLRATVTNIEVPESKIQIHIIQKKITLDLKKCTPGMKVPVPAGFYLQDHWTSFVCSTKTFSQVSQVTSCLRKKNIYMMGDSTLRQWFEYLEQFVPSIKRMDMQTSAKSGPFLAVDSENNIVMRWRAHGVPIRTSKTIFADLHYISNEIRNLGGGPNVVIVFNLCAHFTTLPVRIYIQRVARIRKSIVELLQRSPETTVIIKTANTGYKDVYGSDWLTLQLDIVLRKMFEGIAVVIIDVWQMTSCHYSGENIHPGKTVIQNEVDMFLSFLCPV